MKRHGPSPQVLHTTLGCKGLNVFVDYDRHTPHTNLWAWAMERVVATRFYSGHTLAAQGTLHTTIRLHAQAREEVQCVLERRSWK